MWQIINSEARSAQDLMDLDKKFLETVDRPTLHFYRFPGPSLTYGLLMKPQEHLNLAALEKYKIEMAIRPTGGGALFHLWDLAFSVIIPLSYIPHITGVLERYEFINTLVDQAIQPFLKKEYETNLLKENPSGIVGERFCMAKPTVYDVMIDGKKLVGAAQRVTKKALLHQATISICQPDFQLLKEVLLSNDVGQAMLNHSFYLKSFSYTEAQKLDNFQNELEAALAQTFQAEYQKIFS